ncbi:MAG: hypothetical protein ACK4WM_10680 [Thermoflexales bacterium]
MMSSVGAPGTLVAAGSRFGAVKACRAAWKSWAGETFAINITAAIQAMTVMNPAPTLPSKPINALRMSQPSSPPPCDAAPIAAPSAPSAAIIARPCRVARAVR